MKCQRVNDCHRYQGVCELCERFYDAHMISEHAPPESNYRAMTNSREQQGFPPRTFIDAELFKEGNSGVMARAERKYPEEVEYLSLSEHAALLAEAVREAEERIARTEFSLKVATVTDDERVRLAELEIFVREIANAPFTMDAFRYWRHQAVLLTHKKAASTEGGKGGE
jgi:hypothetical protein